jgi:hypothetical protein
LTSGIAYLSPWEVFIESIGDYGKSEDKR